MATATPVKPISKTFTQGQSFTDPAGRTGIINFDAQTGNRLAQGATTQQTPIDANIIGNTKSLKIPAQDTSSTTGNLGMANNSVAAGIKTTATAPDPEVPTTTDEKSSLKSYLSNLLGNISGQASQENQIRDDLDVAEKKQKAVAISNELDQLDKDFRDEVSQIRKNTEGKFGGAVEADVAKAQDRYENRRANVSLAYKVASGDYQGAEELVTQKIDSLRAQNTQQLQAFNALKDLVYNDLTESEKATLNEQSAIRQNKAKTVEDTYANVLNFASQNKAPASVLSAIDAAAQLPGATAASIMAAAGKYGSDPLVAAQIASANRANQKSTSRSTQVVDIGGKKILIDSDTGETIREIGAGEIASTTEQAQNQIDAVNGILANTKGLQAAVGTTSLFGRGGNYDVGSSRGKFLADTQQLISQLTLDNLINAKAKGATFGALSEGELKLLAAGATTLTRYAKTDKSGNITAFKTSEKNVKKELDTIANFAKKDFILKGGDPASVGAEVMPNGAVVVKNSDGTITQLN
jgi:hypothetical protein